MEFEEYWNSHQKQLILNAPKKMQKDMLEATKLTTFVDWLFFVLPICVGVLVQPYFNMPSEIVSWVLSMLVVVVLFAVLQMVKPYISKKKTSIEALREIKRYYWHRYEKYGLEKLEPWTTEQSEAETTQS